MTETDEMLALNVALQNLLAALPRCEDCDKPATRIGFSGDERDAIRLCDDCRPGLQLYEIEGLIDGMTEPEVRWAPAVRQLRQLLEQPPDTAAGKLPSDASPWIPIDEQPPPENELVLVSVKDWPQAPWREVMWSNRPPLAVAGLSGNGRYWDDAGQMVEVTHWMPLPKEPTT